jgi:CheY-like chemotaxis protein
VWATADAKSDTICFHVRDTGIGIARADIELIFQEFGQVAHRLQSRVKGTGLGLPLSKKLAELLGGKITVESVPGEGSTFSVTLPRSYPKATDQLQEVDEEWVLEPGKAPLLVVEDDAADAFALKRILAESSYQPLCTQSIRQAQLILQEVHPAAILLDIVLLGDESWRLLLQIRQQDAYADIPLVVMSSSDEAQKAFHLGADEYIPKPLDAAMLIGLLDRLTGRHSVTKVLLVDDEEVTRYLVRQLLPRSRFSLFNARNGREGLQLLRDERPDVVLLDVNMPEMTGSQFLERVHDDANDSADTLANAPIIILTSAILDAEERSLLRRARRILSKSDLSAGMLIDAIEDVLRQNQPVLAE